MSTQVESSIESHFLEANNGSSDLMASSDGLFLTT